MDDGMPIRGWGLFQGLPRFALASLACAILFLQPLNFAVPPWPKAIVGWNFEAGMRQNPFFFFGQTTEKLLEAISSPPEP